MMQGQRWQSQARERRSKCRPGPATPRSPWVPTKPAAGQGRHRNADRASGSPGVPGSDPGCGQGHRPFILACDLGCLLSGGAGEGSAGEAAMAGQLG